MSKKKMTMTLKDFHGGSIPSDLPLPSAPGLTVRPAVDRSGGGFDRQMSLGNSTGRSEPRLRPASAGSIRNLDDKAPFLSHIPFIGRNFDEDERKPLDGGSGSRRMVSDDAFRIQSPRVVEPNKVVDSGLGGGGGGARVVVSSRPVSGSMSQVSSGGQSGSSSYVGRLNESHNSGLSNQNFSGNNRGYAGQGVGGPYTNAWGIRKETASTKETASAVWSAPDAETKLAHASAVEKVSSGRWNSKHVLPPQKDFTEGFGHVEHNMKSNYNRLDVVSNTEYHDVVALTTHAERSLIVDVKPTHPIESSYQRKSPVTVNGLQSVRPKLGGPEFQTALPSESSERPKLKLLPRSKPLESLEPSMVDYKQGYQQTADILHVEDSYGSNESLNPVQSGFTGSVTGDQVPERPKLNLKPRSQPLEQLEGKGEVKRDTVFGVARPREMVLKGRGVEDNVSTYESQPSFRVKEVTPKVVSPMHASPRYIEKAKNITSEQKTAKFTQRRDHQVDVNSPQMRERRNETWRNNREVEKPRNQQQQQPQERPPSPDTWRKPVEQSMPASSDATPIRYGKAASAVELAQAFSKSVIDPAVVSGPRGPPGRGQVPFSRLTSPSPRPQINGY